MIVNDDDMQKKKKRRNQRNMKKANHKLEYKNENGKNMMEKILLQVL
jgi:hypothetical protein